MIYYQWQSVRGGGGGGGGEHFYILVISWQFEHFWANNWQGINNSHRTIKLWFNEEKLFQLIFTTYQKLSIGFKVGAKSGFRGHLSQGWRSSPVGFT